MSSLYGQDIYTDRGVYVGKIEDVNVDIKGRRISGLVVKNINPNVFDVGNKKGVIIPYRWVIAIGDIVLIKHVKRKESSREGEVEGRDEGSGEAGAEGNRRSEK